MKKSIAITAFAISSFVSNSQQEFKLEWKTEFPISVKSFGINDQRTYTWATDWKNLSMMDASTGKILWTLAFKEKFGFKKASSYEWDESKQILKLVYNEDKTGEKLLLLDPKTGNTIDENTYKNLPENNRAYFQKYNKFRVFKNTVEKDGNSLTVHYHKKLIVGASNAKTTTAEISCTGKNNWTTTINVKVVRGIVNDQDFLDVDVVGDKVFVIYEGISVLDLYSGKLLWETSFDNSFFDFGVFKSVQELGRAAWPVVDGNFVYVVDLSKSNRCIKKLDLNTGNVLWKTQEEFDKEEIIPNILVTGNYLVAQFGGLIEKQMVITSSNSTTYKIEYKYDGNFGVKVYDIQTGKLIWDTHNKEKELGDKFNDRITNIISDGNSILVCSSKKLYCFDTEKGNVLYSINIKDLKIDEPKYIWKYKDRIIIECESGIASLSKSDGKVLYSVNTNKYIDSFFAGNAFYIWVGKDAENKTEFIRFDLDKGVVMGKIKNTSYPKFTLDGEYFIKFDDNTVYRYSTN